MNSQQTRQQLPLTLSWAGIVAGLFFGIFLVWYLGIDNNLDRFCVLAMAVQAWQLFGSTVGGTWGKPELKQELSGSSPVKPASEDC